MKKSSLLLAGAVMFGGISSQAGALDITKLGGKQVYGKAHADFAYTIQPYTDVDTWSSKGVNTGHAFSFGGGFNVFWKGWEKVEPFAGAELLFRVPLNNYNEASSYREFMMFHLKFGAKLNIVKDVALLPYYIIGFNVAQLKASGNSQTEASLSTGLGIDALYKDKYSVGFEWRYSRFTQKEMGLTNSAFAANNISFKFGYHFL